MDWHDVGTERGGVEARPWLPVIVGGRRVALTAVDGDWFGVADACTHAGCAFSEDAVLEGAVIVCNCHGSEFDLRTGAVLRGPAEDSVATYLVRVRDGRLEVRA